MDALFAIQQVRLDQNPWHCDCRASYVASWLRRRFASFANLTSMMQMRKALILTSNWSVWEFGAGATCSGPGALGGQPLLRLTFHELCEGQWASMRGIIPRLPLNASSVTSRTTGKDTVLVRIAESPRMHPSDPLQSLDNSLVITSRCDKRTYSSNCEWSLIPL